MQIFTWLESTPLALWISESLWGYPIALTCHGIGMAIMVGLVVMVDLRCIGCFKMLSLDNLRQILVIAWVGFALNVISGFSLFSAQASYFAIHPAFLIKLIAIVLAASNVYLRQRRLKVYAEQWQGEHAMPTKEKALAILSLLLWLTAIIAGRLIAYVDAY
jgi:hypothetical protein